MRPSFLCMASRNDFKPVYRPLFGSLKTEILTTVPEAHNLHDRLINLYAAKSDMEILVATKEL